MVSGLFLFVAWVASALGATAHLQVELRELEVGQSVRLVVNVADGKALQPPQVAIPGGFSVRYDRADQKFQPGLGTPRTLVRRYLYQITALQPGVWQVGPVAVTLMDGTEIRTNSLSIRVAEMREQVTEFTAEASFDDPDAWEGQVVLYSHRLTSRTEIMGLDWRLPAFDGLRRPLQGTERHREFAIDEARGVVTVAESVLPLIATGTGDRTQPAALAMVKVPAGRADVLGFRQFRSETVPTGPAPLTILPRPEAPPGFSGLVGEFEISATVGRTEAEVGQSVQLKIHVEGTGTLEGFEPPSWSDIDGFSVYEVNQESTAHVTDEGYAAQAFYERALVPTESGVHELPDIEVVVFSTASGAYETLRAEVPVLRVRGGGQSADIASFEIDRPDPGLVVDPVDEVDFRDIRTWGPARVVPLGVPVAMAGVVAGLPGLLVLVALGGGWVRAQVAARRRPGGRRATWSERVDALPTDRTARLSAVEALLATAVATDPPGCAELSDLAGELHRARYRDLDTAPILARAEAALRGLPGTP